MRTKLLAVLLIPAVAAVVLGGLQVSTELAGVQDLGRTVRQVELGVRTADLVHELQRERELMSGFVATNRTGDRAPLDVQKRRVDALATSVRAAGSQMEGLDDLVRSSYQQAVAALNGLAPLREVAETTQYSDQAVITSYTAMIDTQLTLRREIARATTNRDVAEIAGAADALGRAKEQVAQQHALLLVASLNNELPPNDIQAVRVADSRYGAAIAEFQSVANPVDRQKFADTVTGREVDERERIKQAAVQAAVANQPLTINLEDWDVSAGTTADHINTVEAGLNSQLRGSALALREEAGADVVRDATILLGALFATLLLVVVVARSMLVPLRTLKNTAFQVADRTLPDAIRRIRDADDVPDIAVAPVAVHTREEIGQVARAFDAVHGEAIRLAAEQSLLRRNVNDMFVNLSRRSQGLVERQLRLIDQLENSEQDPEQLSNLFQLDHLATRMRRNSENLLVLAGSELARRSTRPVPAVDVLRAAVSEVEEYQRIVVQTPPPVNVLGLAVNDLVHLVAELLDNATTYSPPDSRVVVSSSLSPQGELVVEITDQGVGMPYDQLFEANHRLADPPVVDVSVSRRMGLFVVGRLAARHGVGVRLRGNEGEPGLTAAVTVPADLVQAGELSDFGPRTDQVPAPRGGGDFLPTEVLPGPGQADKGWHDMQDRQDAEWSEVAANWPATDDDPVRREEDPDTYQVNETMPMQVSMVDSMSGADLFTPSAVPKVNQDQDRPQDRDYDEYGDYGDYDGYGRERSTADDTLREIFDREFREHADDPRLWPDTDQDSGYGRAQPPAPPVREYADAPSSYEPAAPAGEDHLGVDSQVAPEGGTETTPIYEEMVSAWFRELSPPPPTAARPAPSYVEPPPFEMPPLRGDRPYDRPQDRPHLQPAGREEPPVAPSRQEPIRSEAAENRSDADAPSGVPTALRGRHAARAGEAAGREQAGREQAGRESVGREREQPGREREPVRREPARREPVGAQAAHQPHAGHDEPVSQAEADLAPDGGNGEVWRSPADEGWLAAEALTAPANNGFTAAGLPKRKRGAHLVPGAATTPAAAGAGASAPRRARNADDVRGRLASYQQGLRQGRDFRRDLAHASLDPGSEHAAQNSNEERQ